MFPNQLPKRGSKVGRGNWRANPPPFPILMGEYSYVSQAQVPRIQKKIVLQAKYPIKQKATIPHTFAGTNFLRTPPRPPPLFPKNPLLSTPHRSSNLISSRYGNRPTEAGLAIDPPELSFISSMAFGGRAKGGRVAAVERHAASGAAGARL